MGPKEFPEVRFRLSFTYKLNKNTGKNSFKRIVNSNTDKLFDCQLLVHRWLKFEHTQRENAELVYLLDFIFRSISESTIQTNGIRLNKRFRG